MFNGMSAKSLIESLRSWLLKSKDSKKKHGVTGTSKKKKWTTFSSWGFPKLGVPQNGWFMENPY